MSDGMKISDVIKGMDSPDAQASLRRVVSEPEMAPIAAQFITEKIGHSVTPKEAMSVSNAILKFTDENFNGNIKDAIEFLKEEVGQDKKFGEVDFEEFVNSGDAKKYVEELNGGKAAPEQPKMNDGPGLGSTTTPAPATPSTEPVMAETSGEPVPTMVEEGPAQQTTPAAQQTPSALAAIAEQFRNVENINESGFREGIVVGKLPSLLNDFDNAAPAEATPAAAEYAAQVLQDLGIDSETILDDGKIEDFEYAQGVSKAGYIALENSDDLSLQEITKENYPSEFTAAEDFAAEMNLGLQGHEDITIGLVAAELSGNEILMSLQEAPSIAAPAADDMTPQMADPTEGEPAVMMKI